MATSSITKQFVAKNVPAYEKLVREAEKQPKRDAVVKDKSSINRGRAALAKFSLR